MKYLTRLTAILFVLFVSCGTTAQAQSVTVDFSQSTGVTTSPLAFGGTGFPNNEPNTPAGIAALQNAGIKFARVPWPIFQTSNSVTLIPNGSLAGYQSALAAGCPSGSMCDPNTWNFNALLAQASNARNAGMQVIAIIYVGQIPAWWLTNGYGAIYDFNVYQDVVKKMVLRFTPDRVEVESEPDTGGIAPAQYGPIFQDAYQAIHSVVNIPVGGPGTFDNGPYGQSYLTAIQETGLRPDFVTYHGYNVSTGEWTGMSDFARQLWPGMPIIDSEWSWSGETDCSQVPLDGNDPSTVGYIGTRLIADFQQDAFYGMSDGAGGNQVDCLVFQPIIPSARSRAAVMFRQITESR